MVGRTLVGFVSVKFLLIATLKAEKKVFTSSNLLVPAERSSVCGTLVRPGDIWLWVGKTDGGKNLLFKFMGNN